MGWLLARPRRTWVAEAYADLGIGFVQSIGDGETDRLGIGTATYNGDWVAVIQGAVHPGSIPQAKDAFNMDDGLRSSDRELRQGTSSPLL